MANLTGNPATYSSTLRQLEETDRSFPETWNDVNQVLLNNTANLNARVAALEALNLGGRVTTLENWRTSHSTAAILDHPDGSVTAAKLAAGVAVANLGYTPANRAGDTFTGTIEAPQITTPHLYQSRATGQQVYQSLTRSGGLRWNIGLEADDTFRIWAYTDAGAFSAVGLEIGRTGGLSTAGRTVWDSGNDGSGSGLDADLLDGQQGAYYADIPARLGYTPGNLTGTNTWTQINTFSSGIITTGVSGASPIGFLNGGAAQSINSRNIRLGTNYATLNSRDPGDGGLLVTGNAVIDGVLGVTGSWNTAGWQKAINLQTTGTVLWDKGIASRFIGLSRTNDAILRILTATTNDGLQAAATPFEFDTTPSAEIFRIGGNAAWHAGNFTPSLKLDVSGYDWSTLPSKPSTFTPSAHVHAASDTTSGVFNTARLGSGTPTATNFLRGDGTWNAVTWTDVSSKPSTFTPSTHVHAASDTTSGVFNTARLGSGTPTATSFLRGDGTWNAVTWTDVSSKPSTFTPSTHSHAISDTTGLQTALDAKANLIGAVFTGTIEAPQTTTPLLYQSRGTGQQVYQSLTRSGVLRWNIGLESTDTFKIWSYDDAGAFSAVGLEIGRAGGLSTAGRTVWDSGNDGSGSGLDADLLDGQQGAYYADIPARLGYTPGNLASTNTWTQLNTFGAGISTPATRSANPLSILDSAGSGAQSVNTRSVRLGGNYATLNSRDPGDGGLLVTGNAIVDGVFGFTGSWNTAGWQKAINLPVAGTILWDKGTSSRYIGLGKTNDNNLYIITATTNDNSQPASVPFVFTTTTGAESLTIGSGTAWHSGNFTPSLKADLASPALTGNPTINGDAALSRAFHREYDMEISGAAPLTGISLSSFQRHVVLTTAINVPAGVIPYIKRVRGNFGGSTLRAEVEIVLSGTVYTYNYATTATGSRYLCDTEPNQSSGSVSGSARLAEVRISVLNNSGGTVTLGSVLPEGITAYIALEP